MKLRSMVLAAIAACAAHAAMAAPEPAIVLAPAADIALAREILKQLVEIDSTHAHGSTVAAKAIEKRLLAAGFAAADITVLAPADHPTKGNVVVRLHGKTRAKPVIFICHLDVVEAKPEDWTTNPFKLTEKDGYFYGRGTIDIKEGDAVLVENLIRLKREGYQPDRDLIFAFTADEEAGGDANGPAFLLAHHRDLVDAAFALNFDDGTGTLVDGRRAYYELGTAEKIYTTLKLEATSPGGHGSLPGTGNPIYRIADGLSRWEQYKFPVTLTATTRDSFAKIAALEPSADSADMLAVAQTPPDLEAAERLSRKPAFNAQLRTTCVPTLISGGHAECALPQRAQATIQCRMLPSDSIANVTKQLVSVLNDPEITVTQDVAPIQAPESPAPPAVKDKVEAVLHSIWPTVPVVQTMGSGYSDARQFRGAGIPTYGVGGVWIEHSENRAHGRDERVGVAAFDESVEYSYRLIKAFGQAQ